ncbi:hypothetical protein BDN71DRAFT_1512939, partial [Pleurotus eryngii]
MSALTPHDTEPTRDLKLVDRCTRGERRLRNELRWWKPLLRWGFEEEELAARGLDKPSSRSQCSPDLGILYNRAKRPKVVVPAGTFDGLPRMAARVDPLSNTNSHSATAATFSATNAPWTSWSPSLDVVDPSAVPAATNAPSMDWEPSPTVADPASVPATNAPSMSWSPSPHVVDPSAVPNASSMDWEPSPAVADPASVPTTTSAPSKDWVPSPDVIDPSTVPATTNAPPMDWDPSPAVVDPAA